MRIAPLCVSPFYSSAPTRFRGLEHFVSECSDTFSRAHLLLLLLPNLSEISFRSLNVSSSVFGPGRRASRLRGRCAARSRAGTRFVVAKRCSYDSLAPTRLGVTDCCGVHGAQVRERPGRSPRPRSSQHSSRTARGALRRRGVWCTTSLPCHTVRVSVSL
jgi:hypothetical protein